MATLAVAIIASATQTTPYGFTRSYRMYGTASCHYPYSTPSQGVLYADSDVFQGASEIASNEITVTGTGNTFGNTIYTATSTVDVTVETKFTWNGVGTMPTKLKLAIEASSISSSMHFTAAVLTAADGLGDAQVINPPPGTWGAPKKTATSAGIRYREFSVPANGVLILRTRLTGVATSPIDTTCTVKLDVGQADYALKLVADVDPTYHREVSGTGTGIRTLNELLGNGVFYGDTVATRTTIFGSPYLGVTRSFGALLVGSWSSSATCIWDKGNWPSMTNAGGSFTAVADSGNMLPATASPLQVYNIFCNAIDSVGNKTDFAFYSMKVHDLAEKESKYAPDWTGILYKCPDPNVSTRSEFQGVLLGTPISYSGPGSISVAWSCTTSQTTTYGYKGTLSGGVSLPVDIANLNFGATTEQTSNSTYQAGQTYNVSATITSDHRLEIWAVPTGTAEYWYTSRWASDGYANDAQELVVKAGYLVIHYWNAPTTKPVSTPPDVV